jgi:single-strand DNA-binding protein
MIPVTLVGVIQDDPILETNTMGAAVTSFTVRTEPKVYDAVAGMWRDGRSTTMRCTTWLRVAENVVHCFTAGTRVVVVGHLTQRRIETEGGYVTVTEVDADEVAASVRYTQLVLDGTPAPASVLVRPGPDRESHNREQQP